MLGSGLQSAVLVALGVGASACCVARLLLPLLAMAAGDDAHPSYLLYRGFLMESRPSGRPCQVSSLSCCLGPAPLV